MRETKRKTVGMRTSGSKSNDLPEQIKKAAKGLYYISETDAEITPFIGAKAKTVSKEEILRQTKNSSDAPIEERDFSEIFQRLTKIQDWYGEEEIAAANKFAALKQLLENNLKDLKVYKIGNIQIDIYFVGLAPESVLMGIKTQSVET